MNTTLADAAKAKQLREYFARHGRIYIVVNATLEDIRLPDHLKGDPALRLVLNTRMPQPILIRDHSLESDFSFGGQVTACRIPMHGIWAAYVPEQSLEQGIVWETDVPETIHALINAARGMEPDAVPEAEQKTEHEQPEADKEEEPAGGRRVRHLRVVK